MNTTIEENPFHTEEYDNIVAAVGTPEAVVEETVKPAHPFDAIIDGETFVLGKEADIEPLWGSSDVCAWAAGEAMMLFGPQGTGKTTLAQQIMLGRLGIVSDVLGMPVKPGRGKVLYLAMDRPRQAARSMRRMLNEQNADVLRERLEVWKGPLPFDLIKYPNLLLAMAKRCGADTIFVDSVKDAVNKLNDDEAGSVFNRALQLCMADGVEVVTLHHPRKSSQDNAGKPKGVDDIYGSTWITSGHGSIFSLWGKTGDLVIEMSQLKLVNEEVGPLSVTHDHVKGVSTQVVRFDLFDWLRVERSCTPVDAARAMFSSVNPSKSDTEKARRALDKLVDRKPDVVSRVAGVRGGAPARYEFDGGVVSSDVF